MGGVAGYTDKVAAVAWERGEVPEGPGGGFVE